MEDLVKQWDAALRERSCHSLVALAVMNLDFLCIHPFHDGNGRVSRLLWLLQCHQLGYEVGRYISLERLIEEAKDRYYETLEQSSGGWHQGRNDPWPYVNYSVYVLKSAYKELEKRVGSTSSPRGEKRSVILAAIDRAIGPFSASGAAGRVPRRRPGLHPQDAGKTPGGWPRRVHRTGPDGPVAQDRTSQLGNVQLIRH